MTEIEKKFDDQRSNRFKPDDTDVEKKDPQDSIMSLMKNMWVALLLTYYTSDYIQFAKLLNVF